MPDNSKFSNFANGGELDTDDIVVGLRSGVNSKFTYNGGIAPSVVVPVDQGGTGATNATSARTNLGVAIGSDVEAWSASLDALAALSSTGLVAHTGANTFAERTSTGTANEIDIANGNGVSGNPTYSLSATLDAPGTLTVQGTVAVDSIIDDDTMATATDTNLSTSEAIKAYVDNVAGSGFTVVLTCLLGTTANLTGTYANGAAGVGATLTNNSTQVALTIDSVLTQVGDRILVKDQTSTPDNGVYEVTTVGTGATDWVLTRVTDYDTAAEIIPGTLIPVSSGTVNGGSIYLETATVTTVGTDPIVFAIFAQPANTFVTLATTQTISRAKTFSNDVALSGSSTLDLNGTTAIDGFIDDDTFATASATTGATSESIKAYVDTSISSGAGYQSVQVFTSNGTWTKPSGITKVIVEVVGGGGGSGGTATTNSATYSISGGGGGGGYAQLTLDVSAIASETVTIGAAGSGGAAGGATAGGTGGDTTFGAHCTGSGGLGGGSTISSGGATAGGGQGGAATNGDINIQGSQGGIGQITGVVGSSGGLIVSRGGASKMSGEVSGSGAASTVAPGQLYGGGGAGVLIGTSTAGGIGSVGAAGICIVYEYK